LILPWDLCFIGRYNLFATELRQNIPTFAADLRMKVMFWDLVSGYYEVFENLYNGKVNRQICKKVAERISSSDEVLECACGTGMISVRIAAACKHLTATDFWTSRTGCSARSVRDAGI
jgi:ubiquinone/menaquinone biosynthesis C-methylase UbiE